MAELFLSLSHARKNSTNYYSLDKVIEGNSSVSPFVKKLFEESQDDVRSRSLLANRELLARFNRQFGYFDKVSPVAVSAYKGWKDQHTLKCGGRWAIEEDWQGYVLLNFFRSQRDRELQDRLVEASILYREKFDRELNLEKIRYLKIEFEPFLADEAPPPDAFERIEAVMRRASAQDMKRPFLDEWLFEQAKLSFYQLNKLRLAAGLPPIAGGARTKVRNRYLNLINGCVKRYEDAKSLQDIQRGPCGLVED